MSTVFIVGSEGTTGLRLKERLNQRDDIDLIQINESLRKDTNEILRLMDTADFTFLCLPDSAARELAELSKGMSTRIIDTSTAHRTDNSWAYGFPELSAEYRSGIAESKRVSSPGCHASGFIALTRPLIDAGALSPDALISCTSLTGYSGGGKKMIGDYENTGRSRLLDSPMLYAMGQQHKHLPEMSAHSGLLCPPLFLPVVGDFYSGMLVTIAVDAPALGGKRQCSELLEIYQSHYAGCTLVRAFEDAPSALYANQISGYDDMRIFVSGTDGRLILCALFDNLGKGASGAAIECFNIMNGLPEETGLIIS